MVLDLQENCKDSSESFQSPLSLMSYISEMCLS